MKTTKTWSRKGKCPVCKVGTGSKHSAGCTFEPEVKVQKEFIIVGDNNFWYAHGHTGLDLKQAKKDLKIVVKALKKNDRHGIADDESFAVAERLYLFVGEEVDRADL